MSADNVEQSNDVISHIPGGNQKELPEEPQLPEGCLPSKEDNEDQKDIEMKPRPKDEQQTLDSWVKPVKPAEKRIDDAHRNDNNQSPKRPKIEDDEPNNRQKSKASARSGSDDDDNNENNPNQRRSLASLPKLRITFDNSDDEDDNSSHFSWAKRDIMEYRSNYPNARSNSKINDNLKFYTNKTPSYPDGDYIDNIHKQWFGNYRKLEFHHGYIQWLFPLQEQGLNWDAEPLQKHEIESIKKDKKALERILKSYELMLNFYGFKLIDKTTGEIRRLPEGAYRDRFRNLNTSSHNYLRITRILKCLGEFDYEYLKFPFLAAILRESIMENTLSNCLRSCKDYWIETLRNQKERRAIRQYATELIEYRNKGITPPKSHRAIRPQSAPTFENMSLSDKDEDENDNPNQ